MLALEPLSVLNHLEFLPAFMRLDIHQINIAKKRNKLPDSATVQPGSSGAHQSLPDNRTTQNFQMADSTNDQQQLHARPWPDLPRSTKMEEDARKAEVLRTRELYRSMVPLLANPVSMILTFLSF